MGVKIAVSGKGGTGKTTICALIINYLLKRRLTPILAVDADPNTTLAEALGVNFETKNTIGHILDDFLKQKEDLPFGVIKESMIEYKLFEILQEEKGFDLLVMGHGEGSGCYCYPNAVLRDCLDRLSSRYKYTVIDNQAGLEHISRRTNGDLDILLFISDPTLKGIKTAGRLQILINDLNLKIGHCFLIINRFQRELPEEIFEEIKRQDLNLLEMIPEDENIKLHDLQGVPLINLNEEAYSFRKIKDLMEKLKI